MEIYFYYIKNEYIEYLKKIEKSREGYTCVPNVGYRTSDKFMFGAVMEINGMKYYVPVSSYSKNMQDVILIRDKKDKTKILGSLRFAYMIPVPRPCLVRLDPNTVKNQRSKIHITKELAFCRRERDKIFKQARNTYYRVTTKANPLLVKNSCDFKTLEQAYMEYCRENNIPVALEERRF
ncbi:MAG: type III toxin-antitoxin system ToxN/AbiQ family toxin [Ruminococcus sp.]|nr:type III toxin-antitoxin system ToxN/AbiQ family toxin [Ruminococcus sp.]